MRIFCILRVYIVAPFLLLSCGEGHEPTGVNIIHSDHSTNANGIQYYVAGAGSDVTGDGSLSRPWKTVHQAVGAIPPSETGVTLNLRAGTYSLSTALVIDSQQSGSAGAPFTIRSHAGEKAVLDGSQILEFGAMLSIRNARHVTIQDMELTNLVGNKSGIHITGASSNITLAGNTIHNMHWTTDSQAANTPAPTDNLNPIVIVGDSTEPMSDILVVDNKVHNLTTGYSEAIKVTGNIDGFLIDNNVVHDISNIGIVAAGNYDWVGLDDARLNRARNGIIRNNEVYRCVSPVAASAGIYVDGARNITVTDNYSHQNTVGFSVGSEQPGEASKIVLTGNVAADNSQAGVVIGTISPDSNVDNVTLNNNEFRGNYTAPVWGGAPVIINKSSNVRIEDNSIMSLSEYMVTINAASDDLVLNNNRYESATVPAEQAVFSWLGVDNQTYTGFETYTAATGQDSLSTFTFSQDSILSAFVGALKSMLRM